jgi:soluble lytic murein transglycosylase-like protein
MVVVLFSWSTIRPSNNIVIKEPLSAKELPISLQTYYLIEKYRKVYDIPKHVAYNVIFKETGFRGPFHWDYNPYVTSSAGAVGAMQIMPATAKSVSDKKIDTYILKTDLELNIETGMLLLRSLYDKCGSWEKTCGYYNSGRLLTNPYSVYCSTHVNYAENWVELSK